MLNHIIGFSIRNKSLVIFGVLCLIGWGISSFVSLPIDAVPDITNNQVQVITQSPNLASLEIEKFITYPIEVATANIPGLEETRSISRFGLSVVTLVFDDATDVYWARAQVSERLKSAEGNIPLGVGTPELAPVSTGLSEIFQYVIRPVDKNDSSWSLYDLRTIQDWQLKRELLRVAGVADVSSFGGYMKQYHVRVNPQLLHSLHVSLEEVYAALENGSSNTGASYIEKEDKAYFIRGIGMAQTTEDIGNTVVRSVNGIPVLIKDIGSVELSHANRYGAMTQDGKGEVVGGIILMLKGENSSSVIDRVKIRIKELQKTLPKGLVIESFLDREVLVKKAINTVSQNLIEGGLIVILVLILLLGNIRAGLLVASVIPLSMLFAIGMMGLFGVSGNLMSLGAIDFGLIVDGAVIIVEIVVRKINERLHQIGKFETRSQFEETVRKGAGEIMSSAAFGQIIILIVYMPILALTGIEGKMFKPMAMTVSFAIIGAFILSLTYVPMMSALVLKFDHEEKETFADRLISGLRKSYLPVVELFLHNRIKVVLTSLVLMIGSFVLFNTMGGEFLPTLDEGDYALETRLIPGSSLTQSIEVSKAVEKKLLSEFPAEIKTVVAKIGTSEIPTDPMPIEAMDVIIVLNPREEWKRASNKAELDAAIEKVLEDIPGVAFSLQQPIQMRFNELMTNAKTDVVVKLYGKDLDMLSAKAEEIAGLIQDVKGVKDVQAQKLTGLPQIQITYNRSQLATYGISVNTVSRYIETAIAGSKAGVIFENEQGFDLLVKFEDEYRDHMEDFKNLYVNNSQGIPVPLKELAEIEVIKGPAEIGRDDTKRKISVGFNVRERDVQSVVEEIQKILESKLQLPSGYYLTYGGQFENLQHAKDRLAVVLPIALLVIFFLLFLSFNSVKQTLLIFTAIPLATFGGVVSLWLRQMPFSISAGVGFIALFGVAVLNGIVLISYFNSLKREGYDVRQRIMKGVSDRFRPVVMTAMVASIGFLPMALSNGAGAEVQKPLATVVIGGLLSSTILTLLVLPVLYYMVERKKDGLLGKMVTVGLLLFALLPQRGAAQGITLQQAIDSSLTNYPTMVIAQQQVQQQQQLAKTAFSLPNLDILVQAPTGSQMRPALLQPVDFPLAYSSAYAAGKQAVQVAIKQKDLTRAELIKQVRDAYFQLVYEAIVLQKMREQDSAYEAIYKAALYSRKQGAISGMDLLTAETDYRSRHNELDKARTRFENALTRFRLFTGIKTGIIATQFSLFKMTAILPDSMAVQTKNPVLGYMQQQKVLSEKNLTLEKWRSAPGFTFGYFNQAASNTSTAYRLEYGIRFPVTFWNNMRRVNVAKLEVQRNEQQLKLTSTTLQSHFALAENNYLQSVKTLQYFEETANKQAESLRKASLIGYKAGELDLFRYLYNLSKSYEIETAYFDAVLQYNLSLSQLLYLKGE